MARRAGANTGLIWTTVILGFGFLICLVLAIIFSTQIKDAQVAQQRADDSLREYVSTEEDRNPAIVELKAAEGTVVGQLLRESSDLRQKIIGSAQASIAAIDGEMASLELGEGQTLIREIRRLRAEMQAAAALEKELEDKYGAADRRAQAAEAAKAQVERDYNASVQKLQQQISTLQASVDKFRAAADNQVKTLDGDLTRVRRELTGSITEKDSTIAQKDAEIADLKSRIKVLTDQTPRTPLGKIDPSTLPDGHVLSVPLEQNLVYIDLGKHDHVITGITFEVYDRRTGVVRNAQNEYRGKATIEVVNVFDNSSVARVVRKETGKEVFEGDIIANLVYDPDIRFKFYVWGEFDIDTTGEATVSDRRRIENMVVEWGGDLVSRVARGEADRKLTYDVDFLVLGVEPPLPEVLSETEVDPQVIQTHTAAVKKYEAYQSLVAEATRLSVPILNQNRFLVMIGYYQR